MQLEKCTDINKTLIFHWIKSDWGWQMSFMKEINKRGPKTDPWDTPTLNSSGLDLAPSKVVIGKRLER